MIELYTNGIDAANILGERQQDPAAVERVARYLGGLLPTNCFEQNPTTPIGFLARYVPRATEEDRMFADIARADGFMPYWASYVEDRFTTRNPEKVETIRPPIQWRKGQKTRQWVVEPDKREGGVGQLETVYGYSSYDFQQGIRELVSEQDGNTDITRNVFDMGAWYKSQAPRFGYQEGALAPYYYPAIMALTTLYGALYEDFDGGPNAGNGDLQRFMDNVVYPAFAKVEQDLGLKPIIVRLPFQEGMNITDLTFLKQDEVEQFRNVGSKALVGATMEGV